MGIGKVSSLAVASLSKVSSLAKLSIGKISSVTASFAAAFSNTKSIAFDGTNDHVEAGTVTWDMGSLSFWMKSTDTSAMPIMLYHAYQYVIFTSSTFGVRWPSHDGAAQASFLKSNYDYLDGNWHHIVITFDRDGAMGGETTTTIYFDGTSVATKTNTETYTPSSRTLRFGAYYAAAFWMDGSLDEIAWWDATTLSADEVTVLYNSGTPIALDADSGDYTSSGDLTNWWRMGDGDTYPTIEDRIGSNDGTMTNMTSGDIETDVPSARFTFTINTENAGSATKTFVLPLVENGSINFDVNWGDGSVADTITAYDQSEITHVYSATGIYTISITNEVRGWKFNDGGDELKILNISNWGEFNFTERDTFRGCANLTSSATNVPTVSQQYFQRQFMFATSFNGDVSNWDISGSTYTNMCFRGATAFTGIGISTWDMSNVIDISYMFYSATSFDQDLSDWDIGQVSNMSNVLSSVTLSTANYDATLIGWAAQSVQASQSPHFGSSKYTGGGAAAAARASLISEDSWTITDGGIA